MLWTQFSWTGSCILIIQTVFSIWAAGRGINSRTYTHPSIKMLVHIYCYLSSVIRNHTIASLSYLRTRIHAVKQTQTPMRHCVWSRGVNENKKFTYLSRLKLYGHHSVIPFTNAHIYNGMGEVIYMVRERRLMFNGYVNIKPRTILRQPAHDWSMESWKKTMMDVDIWRKIIGSNTVRQQGPTRVTRGMFRSSLQRNHAI